VNQALLEQLKPTAVTMVKQVEEAEADEMWSFVQSKKQQRWLWHAIDHQTGQVLAYVLADHKDQALVELKALLELFGIQTFYTDGWGAYARLLDEDQHEVGKWKGYGNDSCKNEPFAPEGYKSLPALLMKGLIHRFC
jgi:IS1 family transposase